MQPILLDGRTLEGGGQLLRIATCLSALTRTPIEINNIRANRPGTGGLKGQHLASIQYLAAACSAKVQGGQRQSREVTLTPGGLGYPSPGGARVNEDSGGRKKATDRLPDDRAILTHTIDLQTPGSICLVLQAVLPFVLFTPAPDGYSTIRFRIRGGTNVSFSPSYDYLQQVLLPMISRIGILHLSGPAPVVVRLISRGWANKMGEMEIDITPFKEDYILPAFQMKDRGAITAVHTTVLAPKSGQWRIREDKATEQLTSLFSKHFFTRGGEEVRFGVEFEDSLDPRRLYVLLVVTTSNGYKLGVDQLLQSTPKRSIQNCTVDETVRGLIESVWKRLLAQLNCGGCVDEHMRDQLVIFQALAEGKSYVDAGSRAATLHAQTAEWVCMKLIPGVNFNEDGCEGVGFRVGEDFTKRDWLRGLENLNIRGE